MKKQQVKVGGTYSARITDKVVPVRIDKENPRGGWDATNLQTNRQVRIKSAQKLRGQIKVPASVSDANAEAPAEAGPKRVKKKLTAAERKALHAQHKADQDPRYDARLRDERAQSNDGMTASTGGERAMASSAKPKKKSDDAPQRSKDHVKFNGTAAKPTEVYYSVHAGSPALHRAPLASPIDADGYRSDGATLICTGLGAVREQIKHATGKTPGRLGIKLPRGAGEGESKPERKKRDKLSLIDAAVQILSDADEPMNCTQMVEQVTAKNLWSSSGKTPHATLYSAILREIQKKGADARFSKVERGRFVLSPTANPGTPGTPGTSKKGA